MAEQHKTLEISKAPAPAHAPAVAAIAGVVPRGSALSPELADWMSKCPDAERFEQLVKQKAWLETGQRCHECGEHEKRKNLRADTASPYGQGELICRECWDFFQTYVTSRKAKWPKEAPLPGLVTTAYTVDGDLLDRKSGSKIGKVKGFNPATNVALLVTLDSMPDCAEGGIIDAGWEVRAAQKTKKAIVTTAGPDSDSDSPMQ